MPPFAIKNRNTVFVVDPSQIRWLEYSERHGDLTLYYMNGSMECIKHHNAYKVYKDLMLQFNVLDLDHY
jgi:hypothetical protein